MPHDAVVLIDPDHPYADSYIAECGQRWGLRTVCLFHQTPRQRPAAVTSPFVSAVYTIDTSDLVSVAAAIAQQHSIVGVIPHSETYVAQAASLSELLGLPYSDTQVKSRFRNKAALKEHLRATEGGPRVNASCRVVNATDVEQMRQRREFERFVLKPNAGSGNRRIGFFNSTSSRHDVEWFIESAPPEDLIMEELIDGPEFCVNGQVDGEGHATTQSVFRTEHTSANGRARLAAGFSLIHRQSPEFALAADYAEQVVRAAGLRRSPFHLELAIDQRGPCLIEVAARLGGAGMAYDTATAHGDSLNLFATAAADYLGHPTPPDSTTNWNAYDAIWLRTICGISNHSDRVTRVDGVSEIEHLPEFVRWIYQPQVGQRRHPTVDLATIAWQVTIASDSEARLDEVETFVRDRLVINPPRSHQRTATDAMRVSAVVIGHRARALGAAITKPIPALATHP